MTLLDCLKEQFGADWFDATDVFSRSSDTALSRALEREVPRLRYKVDGSMNTRAIRMALRRHPGISKRWNDTAFRVASRTGKAP